jgi:osmotically-inducible protein OsmY
MYNKSRNILLTTAIALALATSSGVTMAGNSTPEITAARQESQIWTTYSLSPYLRANDLSVSVTGETATLTGTVDEDVDKDLAKQIALGVDGIKKVDNQIVVMADYTPPARTSEERSFGQVVDDATITATIKSKLLWGKNTEGMETDVDTRKGVVSLHGTAENAASKELAGRMAKNTRGVVSVNNQLRVENLQPVAISTDEDESGDTSEKIADAWITTKVKSTFMYSSNVESDDITVHTTGGIVTLSGKVSSGAERELATELAQNIRGVNSVNATALKF